MTLQDGWFELVTDCQILKLRPFLSNQAAVPLVGAEGDKSRRRKIAFLVRSQVDWVEGQLLGDSCKSEVLLRNENICPNKKLNTKLLEDVLNYVTL